MSQLYNIRLMPDGDYYDDSGRGGAVTPSQPAPPRPPLPELPDIDYAGDYDITIIPGSEPLVAPTIRPNPGVLVETNSGVPKTAGFGLRPIFQKYPKIAYPFAAITVAGVAYSILRGKKK